MASDEANACVVGPMIALGRYCGPPGQVCPPSSTC
jgi:hypothetical protein